MTTSFDPHAIPDWPNPVVRLTGGNTVEVDGFTMVLPHGMDDAEARRWAVQTVAQKYARLGRAIRVTAIEADGTTIPLIVHKDGMVEPAPVEAAEKGRFLRPRSRPRPGAGPTGKPHGTGTEGAAQGKSQAKGLIAAGVFLGVIALAAVVIVNAGGHGDPTQAPNTLASTPVTTAASTPPPANLPVPAPDGWTTRAAWAVPISSQVTPAIADDGTTAVITDQGDLAVLNPSTGVIEWTAGVPDGASGSLVITRIDGKRVVALTADQTLHYWQLTGRTHEHTAVDLPGSGTVSFLGSSPLISLPDSTAAVVAKGKVRTLDLPVRTTALAADGQSVLAADPSGRWWWLRAGHTADKGEKMTAPVKNAKLASVLGIDGTRLAGIWKSGDKTYVTVYASDSGKRLATAQTSGDLSDQTARSTGNLVAVGPLILDTKTGKTNVVTGTTPHSAAGGRIYSQDQLQQWHALDATNDIPLSGEDVAIPLGIADKRALVVADKLGKKLLYALVPGDSQAPGSDSSGEVVAPQPPGQNQ
ncbi:PQQ-binding-like beta-propeller repeat protein [Streptomyces puniciscabiei]|uniref:PQQ-binding-like beta-propeller repeat protein n=1 Tax=Streptomyces puniciscabiei TaxID=164348 RepID=UPI00332B46C6